MLDRLGRSQAAVSCAVVHVQVRGQPLGDKETGSQASGSGVLDAQDLAGSDWYANAWHQSCCWDACTCTD